MERLALQRHEPSSFLIQERKQDTSAAGRGNGGLTMKRERKQGYQPGMMKKEGITGVRRRSEVLVIILSKK